MPRGDPWPDLRGNQSSICAIVLTGEVSDWNERSDSVEERSLRERCFVGSLGWGLGLALPSQGELMRSPWPWPWRAVCLARPEKCVTSAAKQFFVFSCLPALGAYRLKDQMLSDVRGLSNESVYPHLHSPRHGLRHHDTQSLYASAPGGGAGFRDIITCRDAECPQFY